MLAKVDSAGRVILIPRETFLQINEALDVIEDTFNELWQATFMRMACLKDNPEFKVFFKPCLYHS